MAATQKAIIPLIAGCLLWMGSAATGNAAMERSQWQERGFRPPPPIGTDGVIPRKPFDEREQRCAPERASVECARCARSSDCEIPQPLPVDDRPEH